MAVSQYFIRCGINATTQLSETSRANITTIFGMYKISQPNSKKRIVTEW